VLHICARSQARMQHARHVNGGEYALHPVLLSATTITTTAKKKNITTTTKNYYYYYYCLQLPRICMMRHAHKKDSAHGKPFARHHNKDRHRKREGGFRV